MTTQAKTAPGSALRAEWTNAKRIVVKIGSALLTPSDTLLHSAYLPVADAAVSIARDRMDAAIEALRPAAPYERGTVAALLPIYFRAEARRRGGAFAEAAREFRVVLANRGARAVLPGHPDGPPRSRPRARRRRRPRRQPPRLRRPVRDMEER